MTLEEEECPLERSQLWKKTRGLRQAKELLRDFDQSGPWFAEVFARRASAVGRIFLKELYVLFFVCFIEGNSHFLPYFAHLHRFRTCGKN